MSSSEVSLHQTGSRAAVAPDLPVCRRDSAAAGATKFLDGRKRLKSGSVDGLALVEIDRCLLQNKADWEHLDTKTHGGVLAQGTPLTCKSVARSVTNRILAALCRAGTRGPSIARRASAAKSKRKV